MKQFLSLLFIVIVLIGCSNDEKPLLKGEYLGQKPPGSKAELFAPGIITTGMYTRDVAMTPDLKELYFTVSIGNYEYVTILVVKEINGVWTEPELAEFANNINYKYLEPAISPDGKKFFFISNMPVEGDSLNEMDIWVMNREGDSWTKPVNLGAPVNSELAEYFPSLTNDGTLYFTRDNPDRTSSIFRSAWNGTGYEEPQLCDSVINSGRSRFNSFIAPDESFIIVPTFGMNDSYGATDYYISFRNNDGVWKGPFNMGDIVNSSNGNEWSAYMSRDSKYLFFMSGRKTEFPENKLLNTNYKNLQELFNQPGNGTPAIYWTDASVIDSLRNKYLH